MKASEIKLGDKVCYTHTKYPMVVVGLYTSLRDIKSGKDDCEVYLDLEGNEGDVFEYKASELERVSK